MRRHNWLKSHRDATTDLGLGGAETRMLDQAWRKLTPVARGGEPPSRKLRELFAGQGLTEIPLACRSGYSNAAIEGPLRALTERSLVELERGQENVGARSDKCLSKLRLSPSGCSLYRLVDKCVGTYLLRGNEQRQQTS